MLICFYGDHTHAHTHTQFCLARSGACPGANGTEPDQTGSDWERHVLYSSFWLCAFATLAYWILGFLLFGAFLLVLFYFFCWTSCLSFGSENWTRTWTGPDRLLWGGTAREREKSRNWRQTYYVTLCTHNYWSEFYNDEGFHFNPVFFLFSPPAQSNWMPKSATCHIGVTGENWTVAFICTWFIS